MDRQKVMYIPAGQVARVRELLENGRQYRKLATEYPKPVTEAVLAGLKDTCNFAASSGKPVPSLES